MLGLRQIDPGGGALCVRSLKNLVMLSEFARLSFFALLLMCHCGFIGSAVRRLIFRGEAESVVGSSYLNVFFALGIGLVLDVAGLFVLGLVGAFSRLGVLSLGLVMLALAWVVLSRRERMAAFQSVPADSRSAAVDGLAVVLLFVCTVMAALRAPGYWDDTMYHLPLARSYIQHQAIVVNEYLRFPLFPQNINLLLALGLMWGGDLLAQVFATLPLFVIGLGLIGASQWASGSRLTGAVAGVVLFFIAPVASTLGYAYIDNGLALFCWSAVLALAFAVDSAHSSRAMTWALLAGLLAGAAAGSKLFGAVFAVLAGLAFLLVGRDWRLAVAYGGAVLLTGSWWYVRSFWVSGDPVHPAGGNFFGYYLWNAADLLSQKQEQATHGVSPTIANILPAFHKAGVLIWGLALLGLPLRQVSRPLRLLQLVFVTYLAFWFFVSQVDRYLAPVYGLGMFLSAYTLSRLARLLISLPLPGCQVRSYARGLVLGLLLFPLVWQVHRRAEADMSNMQAALHNRAGYELFAKASKLAPQTGARLVQLGFENAVYFFDGVVIGDWFGPGRYGQMLECGTDGCGALPPQSMKILMEGFDAKMIAISTARFPKFDAVAYDQYFDLVLKNKDGLLLKLK